MTDGAIGYEHWGTGPWRFVANAAAAEACHIVVNGAVEDRYLASSGMEDSTAVAAVDDIAADRAINDQQRSVTTSALLDGIRDAPSGNVGGVASDCAMTYCRRAHAENTANVCFR
jgi:hypothetical protein